MPLQSTASRERRAAAERLARAQDPERFRASVSRYYERNREAVRARIRRWQQNNPEAVSAHAKRWREKNPEKARLVSSMSTHRRRATAGSFTLAEWAALCERYGNRCLACGRDDLPLTIDHIIPISRGGTNWITDVQPLCKPCNQRKYNKVIDYRP